MSTNRVEIRASPDRVFDALTDARTYPEWLVGAKQIREVDQDWPAEGSAFHHTVGMGLLVVRDRTTITHIDRPRSLELEAGVGPLGAAHVRFVLEPTADGCQVEVDEAPSRGVVRALWHWFGRAVMQASLFSRNLVSLEKLRVYVEERR
jgi:uncharacterized protein YndB with AHSA1/START domain